MTLSRSLTKPFRFVRARAKTARLNKQHRREVEQGAALEARADRTPIFLIGPPRSGATLLSQILIEQLDLGYLANRHINEPADVSRVERELRPRAARGSSDYQSLHGDTNGDAGPSEAGPFYYRFFPRNRHQMLEADATPQRVRDLRSVARLFADACGQPVLFKNPFNALRLPVITKALPEALYILMERDLETNSRSLFVGRLRNGDAETWWSAKPDGAEEYARTHTPGEQIVWQSQTVSETARRDLERLAADRTFTVTYNEVCAEPERVVADIHAWLLSQGVPVQLREGAKVPEAFEPRTGGTLPSEWEAQLQDALAKAREATQA